MNWDDVQAGLQSSKACIMIGYMEGKDNFQNQWKLLNRCMATIEMLNQPGQYFQDPATGYRYLLDIAIVNDKKEVQTCEGIGGASQSSEFSCTYCACHQSQVSTYNLIPCERCYQEHGEEYNYCLHHEFMTRSRLQEFEAASPSNTAIFGACEFRNPNLTKMTAADQVGWALKYLLYDDASITRSGIDAGLLIAKQNGKIGLTGKF